MSVLLALAGGCGETQFDSWHTTGLKNEFTAAQRDIGFQEYRALEQALDEELDARIYAKVDSGPEQAYMRYSRGSRSDPRATEPNWNQTFHWPAETPVGGVLLLHGMSDSPYSLRTLGRSLHRRGYTVIGLRLPGHGTIPAGIARVKWQDMQAAVRIAWRKLRGDLPGKPVHAVGFSTGAALAIDLSLDSKGGDQPASMILISPAVGLRPAAAFAGLVSRLAHLPGLAGLGWTSVEPEFDPYKYNSFPVNAANLVYQLTERNAQRMAEPGSDGQPPSFPPTLIFKSAVDATVSTNAVVDKMLGVLAPEQHELVLFDINRSAGASSLLIEDPGPITRRLLKEDVLPFAFTLVGNVDVHGDEVQARTRPAGSQAPNPAVPLGLEWPEEVFSLSHLALAISPNDPLYGVTPPKDEAQLFLGRTFIQGERGLLAIPGDYFLRLRYNPFYSYLEQRALDWVAAASGHHASP